MPISDINPQNSINTGINQGELIKPRPAATETGEEKPTVIKEREYVEERQDKTREKSSKLKEINDPDVVSEAVRQLNELSEKFNNSIKFKVHEGTKRLMIDIVNKESGKIVRSIPPEEILDKLARTREFLGMLFDEKV